MDNARLRASGTANSLDSYTRPLRERLFAIGEFVRFQALGGTLVLPLLGAATARSRAGSGELLWLLATAGSFHVFAYVLNDINDLRVDKTEPLRVRSPLVLGTVQPWQALGVVLLQVPLAFAVASRLGAGAFPMWALGMSFVAMAAYDLWGKRSRFPPATDFVQGIAWAGLIVFGAAAGSGSVGPLTAAIATYVVVYIVMANGVHGSLRDLANDALCGVRSTAILFGARVDISSGILIPRPLVTYTFALQGVLIGILIFVWVSGDAGNQPVAFVGIAAAAGSTVLLFNAIRAARDETAFRSAGMLHLVGMLTAPIFLLSALLDRTLLAVLAASFLIPLAFHEWLPGALRWLWSQFGWVFRLLRVQNCSAAAFATWIGALLAARTQPTNPVRLFLAMAVVWLIVAACNAFNDLRDARIDRLNKPYRPIPSGRISPRTVTWLVMALASAALTIAWALGWPSGAVATMLLGLALWYSISLKNTVLIGNASVGFLAGCTVLYGALIVGRFSWAVGFAAIEIFLVVMSGEILKTIADRDADAAIGYRTLGTWLPARRALLVHAVVACAFAAAAVMPWMLRLASGSYLAVAVPVAVAPIAAVIVLVNRSWTERSLRTGLLMTKAVWFTGLMSLTLLA